MKHEQPSHLHIIRLAIITTLRHRNEWRQILPPLPWRYIPRDSAAAAVLEAARARPKEECSRLAIRCVDGTRRVWLELQVWLGLSRRKQLLRLAAGCTCDCMKQRTWALRLCWCWAAGDVGWCASLPNNSRWNNHHDSRSVTCYSGRSVTITPPNQKCDSNLSRSFCRLLGLRKRTVHLRLGTACQALRCALRWRST
jgi:hypothetical protein